MALVVLALTLLAMLTPRSTSAAGADESYFPVKAAGSMNGLSEFQAQWYSKSLARMKEPRLMPLPSDAKRRIYRLTILPTWGNPISVRVERQEAGYQLHASRLSGQGGYDPGGLVEEVNLRLSKDKSDKLDSLLAPLKFFRMATDEDIAGLDGEEWVLEGVAEGRYHVISRWTAQHETKRRGLGPFVAVCKHLIDNSGLADRPWNKGHELIPK